ncbi:MAG: rod shape-determining protein [Planctomycetes bacterium]|nr:rod shape-determining protein [Planctomycetota bacterium]
MSSATKKQDGEPEKDHGVLYLGIDLGTSRTSVASSNGQRVTLSSHVGYPKDVVSKKLLKKDVLFGDEAVQHRLSLNFYRPLAAGVLKLSSNTTSTDVEGNMKAAADLIREIIRIALPRKDELIYAVIGVPAQAAIHHKDAIIKAARETVDSVMLCSEPFAVAYGLDMLDDVLVIDIGAGTTDLCRMHGTMPEDSDQLTNTFAGDYVDELLSSMIKKRYPEAQFSMRMIQTIKERHASVSDNMPPVIVDLPVQGRPTPFDITEDLRTACRSIVPPMVEGLGQLIATFDPEFQQRLKDRVLLAGGGSQIRGLDLAIEAEMHKRLGAGKVLRIEEPIYGGANGALKIAHDMPAEYWEKLK